MSALIIESCVDAEMLTVVGRNVLGDITVRTFAVCSSLNTVKPYAVVSGNLVSSKVDIVNAQELDLAETMRDGLAQKLAQRLGWSDKHERVEYLRKTGQLRIWP